MKSILTPNCFGRKRCNQADPTNMPEIEVCFPRGGARPPQKHLSETDRSGNLFKISSHNSSLSQKNKKRKKQKKAGRITKVEDDLQTVIEPLTFKTLSTGMITLACVIEVLEFEAKVVLPGGITGKVLITNISQPYTKLLTTFADNPGTVGENVVTLQAMLSVGQTVPCKIISKAQDPVTLKTRVSISLDPKDINEEIHQSAIYHGMVMHSAVSSIEDHGYVMDVGIKGLHAFLYNDAASYFIQKKNNGHPLAVGQLVSCVVNMPHLEEESLEGRTILLTSKPSIVSNSKAVISSKINLHTLIPGMFVDATVNDVKEEGLLITCMDYPGCVYKNNLKDIWDISSKYTIGQKVNGFILYIHPVTRSIYLSLAICPSPQNIIKRFGAFKKKDIVEDAVIVSVENSCIYLKLNDMTKAVAVKSQLSDKDVEHIKEVFSVGQTHRCRILSFDYLDNLLRVSLKESVLKSKHIPSEDLKVGAVFEGTLKKFVKSGVVMKLANDIQGFVRDIYLSDVPLKHSEKIFPPGSKMKCQILQVDKKCDPPALLLTCKKSLIYSKLPILFSYEDAIPDMIVDGVIVLINDQGLLVAFFNGVQGWVFPNDLGVTGISYPEKIFYRGQVVKCRVISCIPQEQKLKLSLKIKDRRLFGTKDMGKEIFEVGKIVSVTVTAKSRKGLDVELIPSGLKAFLPLMHLSDIPANCQLLLDIYDIKNKIEDVLCFSSKGTIIVSKKTSLIVAAKNGNLKYQFADMQDNIYLPAVVKGFASYGMFIETANSLSGLVPKKNMIDGNVGNPADVGYLVQQSIVAKVTKVDHEHQRIEFSTKLSNLYHRETKSGLDILQNCLTDNGHIVDYYSSHNGCKSVLAHLKIGCIVIAKATATDDKGCLFELDCGVKGFASKFHCGDKEVFVENSYTAVVLYVDFINEQVEITLLYSVVHAVKRLKDSSSSKVQIGQVIKCQALLIKTDFVLVSLGGHAYGQFAYLPTRRHLNDIWGRKSLYSVGEFYHLVVKRIHNGHALGALKQHCAYDVEPLKTEIEVQQQKRKCNDESNKISKKLKCDTSENAYIKLENGVNHVDQEIIFNYKKRILSTGVDISVAQNEYNLKIGSKYNAVVKEVKKCQLNIIVNNVILGRVHITEISDIIPEGSYPLREFYVGQELEVWLIGFHHSRTNHFLPFSHRKVHTYAECTLIDAAKHQSYYRSFDVGQSITGFIDKFSHNILWIWLTAQKNGKMDILNLSTDSKILKKPRKYFRCGQAIKATVISTDKEAVELTKIDKTKLEARNIVVGLLNINEDGSSIVNLPLGYCGIISDGHLSTNLLPPAFPKQHFIKCSILEVDHNLKQCKLSTNKSKLKISDEISKDAKLTLANGIHPGSIFKGIIKSTTSKGIIVLIKDHVMHLMPKTKISDTCSNIKSFYIGLEIKGKVLYSKKKNIIVKVVGDKMQKWKILNIKYNKLTDKADKECLQEGQNKQSYCASEADLKSCKYLSSEKKKSLNLKDTSYPEVERKQKLCLKDDLPRLNVSEGFQWDVEGAPNLSSLVADLSKNISSSDSEKEEEANDSSRKKSKKQKKQQEKLEENYLFKTERLLMDTEREPENVDDFDRLVLASPNSSIIWLQYMAFHLQQAEIDKARAVAERALKTISFREEQEKLNVWVSLLNLENLYGTRESLNTVFQRAVQFNEPLKVYNHLAKIYMASNKLEETENIYNNMIKRFRQDKQVWIDFGDFLMKIGKPEYAHKLMQRSLKSLVTKDHVEVISKFAQMEFKHGDPERGKTLFESILNNYTKRTDLWSIYIDLILKQGDIETVRHILERVITLKLPVKKMKFFFKKYLDIEKEHGTEETVNAVKEKALEYVESVDTVESVGS